MSLKIKSEYRDVVIGYNNSSLPLGSRNDTHLLYELAKEKNLKHYLDMFEDEEKVTEETIKAIKEESFIAKQKQKSSTRKRR